MRSWLSSETCAIEPFELRPIMPNGTPLEMDRDDQSISGQSEYSKRGAALTKMIDYTFCLDLKDANLKALRDALSGLPPNYRSLNQTLGWPKNNPFFLDIELKKMFQNRDPRIQLAIWAMAAHKKRQLHGWDTSMPMPGITVDAHIWTGYIFFEMKKGEGLVCLQSLSSGHGKEDTNFAFARSCSDHCHWNPRIHWVALGN